MTLGEEGCKLPLTLTHSHARTACKNKRDDEEEIEAGKI